MIIIIIIITSEFDLGRTNLVQHRFDTGINRPFKQQLRRHPMAYPPVFDEHVDKMLTNDICETSFSPWASIFGVGEEVRRDSAILYQLPPAHQLDRKGQLSTS